MGELYGSGGSSSSANNAIERAKLKINGTKEIQIQFNPASLSFSSSFNDTTISTPAGTNKRKTASGKASANTTMSVDLLFDAVNKNAKEKSKQPTYMSRQKGGKAGATRFFPEIDGDVKGNVNEFYDIMQGCSGRNVEFMWGKLCFKGIITSANMEITLFDRNANPLRASVKLQIVSTDDNDKK